MSYASLGAVSSGTTVIGANRIMRAPPPAPKCLTREQLAEAKATCTFQSIRGLGALPAGNACDLAQLPICPPATATFAAPMQVATPAPRAIAIAKSLPAPPPVPPALTIPPGFGPAPAPVYAEPVDVPEKKMNVAVVGLLALVALGGGYLVYRQVKKPKMAANRRRRR